MNKSSLRILSFLGSVKIAIILLIVIALYFVIGTVLVQHSSPQWYAERYPTLAPIILFLQLDSAYSSPIFIVLVALFGINLSSCTILSIGAQKKLAHRTYFPPLISATKLEEISLGKEAFLHLLKKEHYSCVEEPSDEIKGAKYRWGVYGATITHIGILILCVGGIVGSLFSHEEVVQLLPGHHRHFEQQGFVLFLEDFYMDFEPNGAVKQYYSDIRIQDDDKKEFSRTIWVNNPLRHKGLGFYQATFGWTGNVRIKDRVANEILAEGLLRAGRTFFEPNSHLTVYFFGYYPEMAVGHDQQPVSLSQRELNPYYAVILYEFGNPAGSYVVGPNESIFYKDYEITFTHAVPFTGLLVRSDPSYPIALVGFIVILLGMLVSFYFYPRYIFYSQHTIYTYSRRNGWVFQTMCKSKIGKITKESTKG